MTGSRLLLLLLLFVPPTAFSKKVEINKNAIFDVLINVVDDCGAVGDGITDDTTVIQSCMDNLDNGEGRTTIWFPINYTFSTFPLVMNRSNLTLHIDGILKARLPRLLSVSNNKSDDWPIVPPLVSYGDSEDGPVNQYQAFIYAEKVHHIAITGNGTIDGSGPWWWQQFTDNRRALRAGRPNLIQWVQCHDVEISYVLLKDSPFWTLHPVLCQNVYIHHVVIRTKTYAPNADGIDPDSCRNVLIEYNDVGCGDDHIAIKSGLCGPSSLLTDKPTPNHCATDSRFVDGTFLTSNITIRNNIFRNGMGISIGSEMSGGVEQVYVTNNSIAVCPSGHDCETCCGWSPALHIKTTLQRGGFIRDVVFANNDIYNTTGFILVETHYQSNPNDEPPPGYPPVTLTGLAFINNRVHTSLGATFDCSKYATCRNVTLVNNTIFVSSDDFRPWDCSFVESYHLENNYPDGLEECMANSMNQTMTAHYGSFSGLDNNNQRVDLRKQ